MTNLRTIHDPNEFIIDGDNCWVILYNRKCEEVARAKFHTKHHEILRDYKWRLCDYNYNKYAITTWFDEDGRR